jgi:hypothetical protein
LFLQESKLLSQIVVMEDIRQRYGEFRYSSDKRRLCGACFQAADED